MQPKSNSEPLAELSAAHDAVITQTNSIFQQPWWLEAVAPGQWDAVVVQQGDEVVARMPYVLKKKHGLTVVTMPKLTQTLGPWISASDAKYTNQLSRQKELMGELIEKLPKYDLFSQNFSPEVTNWLPFYWAGFSASLNYTYRIEDLTNLDAVWSDFRENIRREIRKSQKVVAVRDDLGIEKFLQMARFTFQRQNKSLPYSEALVHRLDEECGKRNARRILFAVDAEERVHAAVFLVWDEKAAYYLMSGGDPQLRSSGATSLLIWETIKFAASVSKTFDFEGSMIEPIERYFRAFGARQVPYLSVSRMGKRMRMLAAGNDFYSALRGKEKSRLF
jgi:hypothetical protein